MRFIQTFFLFIVLTTSLITQAQVRCESLFTTAENAWTTLYKKSDHSPRPELWLRIRQSLAIHVQGLPHPLETAGQDADRIGAVYKNLAKELPILSQLIQVDRLSSYPYQDFIVLKRTAANEIIRISYQPKSKNQVFAALEALRILSSIESKVEFPKTEEQKKKEEEKKKQEEQKKKSDQKKDQKKDQKQKNQGPKPKPQWNKPEDQYKPENKDISNDGSGGGQETVDIAKTNAPVLKKLLRQKIYDQFDLKTWTSQPVQRSTLQTSQKPTKEIIIDPLGSSEVDIPLPYGYSLVPGRYGQSTVKEVGPGELKLLSQTDKPVVLPLVEITGEGHLPRLQSKMSSAEMKLWPQDLLLFAQSLKGKTPIEAATLLEKYISVDGGYLYYSKGDKISANQLQEIEQKFNQLKTQMPDPMAMAHLRVFNCDGAAWIGALLLRDVLGAQVRIAGGRTSAGIQNINSKKYHVVRSSDPAHAWLEVFDGQRWVPFDMTPKKNVPDQSGDSSQKNDLERDDQDQDNQQKQENDQQKDQNQDQKDQQNQKGKQDQQGKNEKDKDKNQDQKGSDKGKGKDKDQDDKKNQEPKNDENKNEDQAQDQKTEKTDDLEREIQDILNSKSTQRQNNESQQALVERLLKRNELLHLESLIYEGFGAKYSQQSEQILAKLNSPLWTSMVERSRGRISTHTNEARLEKFNGMSQLQREISEALSQNQLRKGQTKILLAKRLLLALADHRQLTRQELQALQSLERILKLIEPLKHENSKEFDVVEKALQDLPGTISKEYLKNKYGNDFTQLGGNGNVQLANDLVKGKLKPLLQMGAVSEFVDMTLNSTPEARFKDEPTLNKSLVPKVRQDLIITRNPLDFAKMLWNPRPGEHMFAPTLQGRQFAIGSLETRRVPDPKNPIERKVSVIYYDISGSMQGPKMEAVDALLMAYADKALSEVDAIGRPTHEIYLIPFNDHVLPGVHISSREDALQFLTKKMSYATQAGGGTSIQSVLENFYKLIGSSYQSKSSLGREKLFQRANMVLFSDGEAHVNVNALQPLRNAIPPQVNIHMNFVSLGENQNQTLIDLAGSSSLSSKKPTYRSLNQEMLLSISNIRTEADPEAFASTERLNGGLYSEIQTLLQNLSIDPRLSPNKHQINKTLSQIQITKQDASQISGLRELINLTRIDEATHEMNLEPETRQRLLEALVEAYPTLTGRSWRDMTYQERDLFQSLQKWSE
ncbi:MAG: hypothetical protein BroJett040_07610 [Oligoflexia bacterium]|nr:MAG: hypothetical protein BroJett040_07610 [Oligoflexia bacterium]